MKKLTIGLLDCDNFKRVKFPNLALMKISAYHKSIGNTVVWFNHLEIHYDKLYVSKVFNFKKDININSFLFSCDEIIKGGTGYNFDKLPDYIDRMCPDYSIYPQFPEAYGFLTRGCPNKCSWCIVPVKEGNIKPYADITDFLCDRKIAVLMDNNILAIGYGLKQIEKIIDLKIKVDFNQGLDARIIANNKDIAELLSRLKWYKPLRMSCDTLSQMENIRKAVKLLKKYRIKIPDRFFVYVLVKNNIDEVLKRVNFLKKIGCRPYVQIYRDFSNPDQQIDKIYFHFARWVNALPIFNTVKWKDYKYNYLERNDIYGRINK